MNHLMISLTFTSLMVSIVPVQSQRAGDQSNIPAEEYAIYAAVIGDMFVGGNDSLDPQSRVKMLVIEDRTVSNTFAAIAGEDEGKSLKQGFSSIISQEAIDDYVTKNAKSHQLTNSLDLKLKYTLIGRRMR
jgi:hypothetical protein